MTPAPVLELRSVTKAYPGHPPTIAVDDIDITIHAGELLAIVGPSGSGKTTAMHLMGTLERPTSGAVLVAGIDTTARSDAGLSGVRATRLGFVFQQFVLLEHLTVLENVANGLLYRGDRRGDRRRLARIALDRVGLSHRLRHRPNQLSGGEQQRVAIARAVVGSPAVVLADEPTGNLDSRSSASIVELLLELHADGTTIAVITHDHRIADSFPRHVEMSDGHVVHDSGVAT